MGWIEDNTNNDPIAKKGMRIRMISMNDPNGVDEGLEGTIVTIDGLGTLHVKWDDGSKLGVIPGVDEYQVLPSEDEQIDFDVFGEGKAGNEITKTFKKETKNIEPKVKVESEDEIDETTMAGSAGAFVGPLGDKKNESKIVKVSDLLNEMTSTGNISSTVDFLVNNLLGWATKEDMSPVWPSPKRLSDNGKQEDWWWQKKPTYNGGVITDPYAKTDETWDDENLEVNIDQDLSVFKKDIEKNPKKYKQDVIDSNKAFDVNVDSVGVRWVNYSDSERIVTVKENVNEGWLKKTEEDKLALEILERVKEEYPQEIKTGRFRYGGGNYIEFTLEGIRGRVRVRLENKYAQFGDFRDSYDLWVNDRELLVSRWAIKKLYKYISKEFTKRKETEDLKNIETDLISPDYAQDVFDMLGDSEQMNETKKSKESPIHTKKWERCVKDVEKKNKENKTDYNPYAVCQKSIGYEGSIKKPHRRQEELEETTTFSSVFGGGFPVTPFMFAKKGKHIPSKKTLWKGGKIVQKIDKADLLGESLMDEINKVKWVKGGKYVKIKDKCAKYNNQPWCSQGAIDNPLELSDSTFENIQNISKKTGLSEEEILNNVLKFINEDTFHKLSWMDRLKIKLSGIDEGQVIYNLNNNLPIDWNGTKDGYYEKMEPKNGLNGSN